MRFCRSGAPASCLPRLSALAMWMASSAPTCTGVTLRAAATTPSLSGTIAAEASTPRGTTLPSPVWSEARPTRVVPLWFQQRVNSSPKMHLVGQLSRPSSSLDLVLDIMDSGPGFPEPPSSRPVVEEPEAKRLGNGVVQRAVVKVLAAAQRPLTVPEAQAAVVDLLGHPVSKGSINCCLSTGALGNESRFERTARGCYRLIRSA
jgi:hypothetical protein